MRHEPDCNAVSAEDAYKKTAKDLLDNPDDPKYLAEQYALLSNAPRNLGQLALAKRCAAIAPREFIAVFNYGSALMRCGQDSVVTFRRALDLVQPEYKSIALHHLGLAYHARGEFDTALVWYLKSRELNPSEPKIDQSIAIAKLAMGKLKEGLYEFEVLHHVKPRKAISDSGIPWWNGEDLNGKRVILAHEQGFGDTLQFIRFAPLLKAKCRRLVFSGPEELAPLIAEQFDCFDDVINEVGPFEADYVTSPMSSCALMGIEYKDINGLAYMSANPLELPRRSYLKVGISWKGSPGYSNDGLRSASLSDFCPLFDLPNTAFYSLQVRPEPVEISELGLDGFIADLGSTLTDWRSTASAIEAMDVLVTTCTANAHMAGALGKPVLLVLGRDQHWTWMRGNKTPWYRNHKLLRQAKVDEWPMGQVRRELENMLGRRTQIAA
jgi:tetratricopeptide (TPR) repeat protein